MNKIIKDFTISAKRILKVKTGSMLFFGVQDNCLFMYANGSALWTRLNEYWEDCFLDMNDALKGETTRILLKSKPEILLEESTPIIKSLTINKSDFNLMYSCLSFEDCRYFTQGFGICNNRIVATDGRVMSWFDANMDGFENQGILNVPQGKPSIKTEIWIDIKKEYIEYSWIEKNLRFNWIGKTYLNGMYPKIDRVIPESINTTEKVYFSKELVKLLKEAKKQKDLISFRQGLASLYNDNSTGIEGRFDIQDEIIFNPSYLIEFAKAGIGVLNMPIYTNGRFIGAATNINRSKVSTILMSMPK